MVDGVAGAQRGSAAGVIVLMLLLINRKDLMGSSSIRDWMNVVAWTTVGIVVVLSVALMFVG